MIMLALFEIPSQDVLYSIPGCKIWYGWQIPGVRLEHAARNERLVAQFIESVMYHHLPHGHAIYFKFVMYMITFAGAGVRNFR